MPKISHSGEECIGYNKEELAALVQDKYKFCLDFGHAAKAALSLGVDYKVYINGLLELKPSMFHINDVGFKIEEDEHMNFGEGRLDIRYLKRLIGENPVTLETPRSNHESFDEDLKNLDYIKKI